jgi:hypothetical protein
MGVARLAGAARFGVPDAGGDPPGYFVLTGPQIPPGAGNLSWGDQRHGLDLYVEVTGTTLDVDIYDPGLVGVAPGGLDAFFNGTVGTTTYRLFDPLGALLAEQTFGSDTVATDLNLVRLFGGATSPGLHRIEVRMDDTPTDDQDINAFGISVPGYDLYSYSFTGGEVNLSGATIAQPLVVYPWLPHSTPATVAGLPATGVDVSTWDLDSATSPPDVLLETPSGRAGGIAPSPDSGLVTTNLSGIDVGPLDCSDYGIYRLAVDNVGAATEGGNDINIFTSQLYDYNAGVMPADFPILPGDPHRPIRLYYPRDDGSPPLKERLVHAGRVIAGPDPPAPGVPSTIEVLLELRNPTAYDLSSVDLVTRVATDPRVGAPVVISTSPMLTAVVTGQEIRVTGSVPPGQVGSVTYDVIVTPTAVGSFYLTGDGTDLQGGTLPTEATCTTPFERGLRLGPVCMLRVDAMTPICSARAVIGGNLAICEGDDVVLDAAGSSVTNCPGALERRWLRDGIELFAYPGPPTITDAPATDTVYELEIRCDAQPACTDSSAVTVRVEPDVPPAPVGDTLRVMKEFGGYRFTWAPNGSAGYHLRQRAALPFDRPSSALVATVTTGDYFLLATPPMPFRVDFYLVFAANCAGTEEP